MYIFFYFREVYKHTKTRGMIYRDQKTYVLAVRSVILLQYLYSIARRRSFGRHGGIEK